MVPSHVAVPDAPPEAGPGYLPAEFGPITVGGDPSKPDFRVRDLEPSPDLAGRLDRRRRFLADFDRLNGRASLLDQLDSARRTFDTRTADTPFDRHRALARAVLTSGKLRDALDVQREPARLRDRYGMTLFGQSCLAARRLLEAGGKFVTVCWDEYGLVNTGWDTHVYQTPRLKDELGPGLDNALAALLDDLDGCGRLDDTLVMVMGEFGRTPKLNSAGGRDHWPRAFSVLLVGAGVRGGQAVGRTDARGESPADRPVSPADLARTVYTLLGIDPDREFQTADGRPVRIAAGAVIPECLA